MKNIIRYSALALVAIAACGCNDAEYGAAGSMGDKLGVHAYIVESNSAPGIANTVVTLGSSVTNLALTPSLTDKNDADAEYRLVIDKDMLTRFNEAEGTSYDVLPEDLVHLESAVKIPAGKYSQDPFIISIDPLPANLIGTPFALPLRMEKVSGNADVTGRTSSYVYVISSEIIDDVAKFNGASGLRTDELSVFLSLLSRCACRYPIPVIVIGICSSVIREPANLWLVSRTHRAIRMA